MPKNFRHSQLSPTKPSFAENGTLPKSSHLFMRRRFQALPTRQNLPISDCIIRCQRILGMLRLGDCSRRKGPVRLKINLPHEQ